MIAALSPADVNYDETLSTLRCVWYELLWQERLLFWLDEIKKEGVDEKRDAEEMECQLPYAYDSDNIKIMYCDTYSILFSNESDYIPLIICLIHKLLYLLW